MSNFEKRIKNLEKHTGIDGQIVLTAVRDGDTTKPTEEQTEAAIADFKANKPDFKEDNYILLYWEYGQYRKAGTVF